MRRRRYNRRNTNVFNHFNILELDTLQLISKVLCILILIFLCIFIYSSIKVKKSTLISNHTNISKTTENSTNNENISGNNINDSQSELNNSIKDNQTKIETNKNTTINMAFTGDIMCHNTIYNDAYDQSTGIYDFSYIFDNIKYYIQTADIAVGNLETTFAGSSKAYSSYPTFNTPESMAYNLKKLGFDVLSTANNHCYDSGYSGIESTINYLDEADIAHTGTYKSEEEQNKILIQNVKGIKIAFLSFTYGTNGIPIPNDKGFSVNLINKDLILNQLNLAKAQSPDLICVSMHWGTEYQTTPNSEQLDLTDFLFNNGADLIIGNHPHVLQPMEKRSITLDNGTTKEGFIVYSLGNFLADQNKTYTRDSAILNLNITKHSDNKITINYVKYTPIYTYKNTSQSNKKFKIIDLKNTIASYDAGYDTTIGTKLYHTFKSEFENVKKLLGDEIL